MTQTISTVLCEQIFHMIIRNPFLSLQIGLNCIMKIPRPKCPKRFLMCSRNLRVIHNFGVELSADLYDEVFSMLRDNYCS